MLHSPPLDSDSDVGPSDEFDVSAERLEHETPTCQHDDTTNILHPEPERKSLVPSRSPLKPSVSTSGALSEDLERGKWVVCDEASSERSFDSDSDFTTMSLSFADQIRSGIFRFESSPEASSEHSNDPFDVSTSKIFRTHTLACFSCPSLEKILRWLPPTVASFEDPNLETEYLTTSLYSNNFRTLILTLALSITFGLFLMILYAGWPLLEHDVSDERTWIVNLLRNALGWWGTLPFGGLTIIIPLIVRCGCLDCCFGRCARRNEDVDILEMMEIESGEREEEKTCCGCSSLLQFRIIATEIVCIIGGLLLIVPDIGYNLNHLRSWIDFESFLAFDTLATAERRMGLENIKGNPGIVMIVVLAVLYNAPIRLYGFVAWVIWCFVETFIVSTFMFCMEYSNSKISNYIGILIQGFLVPWLLLLATHRERLLDRRLFAVTKQKKMVAVDLQELDKKVRKVLCHVIPKEYVGAVQMESLVVQDQLGEVAVVQVDLVQYTAFVNRCTELGSAGLVIEILNHSFSAFDHQAKRLGVMKMRQEGDAWIACSWPIRGMAGVRALLQIVGCIPRLQKRLFDVYEFQISFRCGLSLAEEGGRHEMLVVWGNATKSFDLVGSAMEEAEMLEQNALTNHVHIRFALWKEVCAAAGRDLEEFAEGTDGVERSDYGVCVPLTRVKELVGETREPIEGKIEIEEIGMAESSSESDIDQSVDTLATSVRSKDVKKNETILQMMWKKFGPASGLSFLRSPTETPSEMRKKLVLNACQAFLLTFISFLDLFLGSQSPSTGIVIVAPFLYVALFVGWLACLFLLPQRSNVLASVSTGFSIVWFLSETLLFALLFATCRVDYEAYTRNFVYAWVKYPIHSHVPVILRVFTVVPVPLLMVLHATQSIQVDFLNEDLVVMQLYVLEVLFYATPVPFLVIHSVLGNLRKLKVMEAQQVLQKQVVRLREKLNLRTTLISSFLPPHVIEAVLSNRWLGYQLVERGGVVFLKWKVDREMQLESIGLINEQICRFDSIVINDPSLLKIKSTSSTFLAIVQECPSLVTLLSVALLFKECALKELHVSCGLSIGIFYAGIIGQDRWCFDVIGPSVNAAARLASLDCQDDTDECQIWCFKECVEEDEAETTNWEFEAVGERALKGFGEIEVMKAVGLCRD